MSDERMRELERKAKAGDEDAQMQLTRLKCRRYGHSFAWTYVNKPVMYHPSWGPNRPLRAEACRFCGEVVWSMKTDEDTRP